MHAIYCRVSTEEQARSGYSLADQIRSNRQKLYLLGVSPEEINEYIDDGYSGEFLDRPALTRLRNDVAAGLIAGYISVLDPDRLSRNLTNTLLLADEFEKSKATLIYVTAEYDASPEGKLFFSIRGAVAAFEKAKTRERTMRGKRAKARAGKIVAYFPLFGYDWDEEKSNYRINDTEAQIVREIYALCIQKKLGLLKIANELNGRGLSTKSNTPFSVKSVYMILTRTEYAGTRNEFRTTWKKTGQSSYDVENNPPEAWISVTMPAIITADLQKKAKTQLAANRKTAKRNLQRDYLLSGLLKCGICGHGLVAAAYKYGPYYICYGNRHKKTCNLAYIRVDEIEKSAWDFITFLAGQKMLVKPKPRIDHTAKIAELQKQAAALSQARNNITALVTENLIDFDQAKTKLRQLTKTLLQVNADIKQLKALQAIPEPAAPSFRLSDITAAKTVKQRKEYLQSKGLIITVTKYKNQADITMEIDFVSS